MRVGIVLVAFGSAAVSLASVMLALRGQLRRAPAGDQRRVTFDRLAPPLAAAAMVFLGTVLVGVPLGLDFFGVAHVAFAHVALVPGATGAVLLVLRVLRVLDVTRPVLVTSIAVVALPLAAGYASFIEPFRLQLETADIALDRVAAPLTIGVVADLQTNHVTDHERDAIARMMEQRPDLLLLPGDFFQGTDAQYVQERDAMRALVAQLKAEGGVFAVLGNVDTAARARDLFEGSAVRLLDNAIVETEVRGQRVTIGGVELDYRAPRARATIDELQARSGDDARILLAHLPDALLSLTAGSRIDLVVAGHTHGGQVVLPLVGAPVTLSRVPHAIARGGLHERTGNRIYLSRGVGWERRQAPRVRFLCPPEISLLTLR